MLQNRNNSLPTLTHLTILCAFDCWKTMKICIAIIYDYANMAGKLF